MNPAPTVRSDAAPRPRLVQCLRMLTEVAPEMRLNQIVMLLVAADDEGILMGDLARRCGESHSTVSRGIRKLSSPDDPGALMPAYGLVQLLSDASDRRARHIVLTPKGRAVARRLSALIADPVD